MMFSNVKRFYKKIIGFDKLFNQSISIQNNLIALHKKSDELYWGMIFNNAVTNSGWLINRSFNPGRWAAGYPMLYILFRIYNDIKPLNILEFGLGESTKLAYQYNKSFPESHLKVIEQDKTWLDYFSNQIFDIRENTIILEIEQVMIEGAKVNQYKDLLNILKQKKFDMIVIDGPLGSPQNSRYQIVDMVLNDLIAKDFIIIMDDYNRLGEKQTIEKLKLVFNEKNITFSEGVYSGIKDTYIVCSKQFEFLTSL